MELPETLIRQIVLPFPWKQGEHLTISGETGSGKTTLANVLLYARKNTIAFRSKKTDDTPLPGKLVTTDVRLKREMQNPEVQRILLHPKYEYQRPVFWNACELIAKAGYWSVYFDELFYLEDKCKLTPQIERFLTQGRSERITTICGMQRPLRVTRYALSEPRHLIAFFHDGRDIKVLAELGSPVWAEAVENLEEYQFAWWYRPKRQLWVGKVQDLIGGVVPA